MNTVLTLLLSLMAPGLQDAPKEAKPLKIGVVNLKHCFDKDRYERIAALDTELQVLAAIAEPAAHLHGSVFEWARHIAGVVRDAQPFDRESPG